jgi:hypothetical protein
MGMIAMLTFTAIVVGGATFYNMWLFDCLARWEYEHHREQWERDGKPSGFLTWRPKEPKSFSIGRVEQHLNMKWTFKTPDWATTSPECHRWIVQKRISSLAAALVILVLLLGMYFRWW